MLAACAMARASSHECSPDFLDVIAPCITHKTWVFQVSFLARNGLHENDAMTRKLIPQGFSMYVMSLMGRGKVGIGVGIGNRN